MYNLTSQAYNILYFVVYGQLDAGSLGGKYGRIGMESLDVQYDQF